MKGEKIDFIQQFVYKQALAWLLRKHNLLAADKCQDQSLNCRNEIARKSWPVL